MPACPGIGIDLGTTYSCVAGFSPHDHTPCVFLNGNGQATTPSWIAFTEKGKIFGKAAVCQQAQNSENTIFDVKRVIGRLYDDPVVQTECSTVPFEMFSCPNTSVIKYRVKFLDGKTEEYTCEQVSSMLLRSLAKSADAVLGQPPTKAVITVPAHFNDSQRRATKDAGVIAGLEVLRIVNEPTAAALAYYGLDNKELEEDLVLVYDLGGGTFDVSILRSESDSSDGFVSLEVEATGGDTHLGGRDFDRKIAEYFDREFEKSTGKNLKFSIRYWSQLLTECERLKIELSTKSRVQLDVGELFGGSLEFVTSISRAKFEQLIKSDLDKTTAIIDSTLKDAGFKRDQIKRVLLVGGSTKIPRVRTLIKSLFPSGVIIDDNLNPDEVVARGAALLAAHLSGDYLSTINQDATICLLDATPLSLGTDISGNRMSVIIPRGSTIPSEQTRGYVTSSDNQTTVQVLVYQGERQDLSTNHLLGGFEIDGIPPKPKGEEEIDVTFVIDVDGILQVTAKIQSTGVDKHIVIDRNKMNLSPDEVCVMLEDAEKYALRDAEWERTVNAEMNLKDALAVTKKSFRYQHLMAVKDLCHNIETWLKVDSSSRTAEDYDNRRESLNAMMV